MRTLRIRVLGPLQIGAGRTILKDFVSNKVRALLVYLAVEMGRPHGREALGELLWPESSAHISLANLRYALADLRKAIGDQYAKPPYLIVNRERLQFNASSDHTLDAAAFEESLRAADIEQLKHGIAFYQGDFLSDFPSVGSDPFEEWIALKREQYKREAIEALRLIVDHHEQRGEYQQAIPFARRQVELEPWLEEAYQQLMRLLALDGQRTAALAQYEACRRVLASELDVEPAPETIQLYESIRDGMLEKAPLPLKREPPAPGDPPFRGLQSFDETDAGLFFGRETLVSHLVEQMHAREQTRGVRFLAIIGASGSGKSSLVRAGLIPALKRDPAAWLVHVVTPTEHPLESLSSRLGIRPIPSGRMLLFVDQFEELFTLCQSEGERRAFINQLLEAAREGSIRVVIALRADFYAACAPYENLRKLVSQNQEYIGPMNTGELRRAIEEPARINGWRVEPGLVDLLLHDIGADGGRSPEPGALPLLSHALLETWRRRSGRMLTLAGYAEAGSIHEAITKTAETVFAGLSLEEQSIARNIFLRLTELGEGTQETRRRVSLSEIIPPASASSPGETTRSVLKMLSDARLITMTEATAEVAHEALIREWSRLHEWLTENREGLRLQRHITESAREWETHRRDKGLVYRGTRLAQALESAQSHSVDLNPLEQEFLEASQTLAEQELAEGERQRQRELEAARKLAEAERQRAEGQARAAKQLRRGAFSLAGLLLLALVLAAAAFLQRNAASQQAHLAASREMALASINNLGQDPELSVLLALQAASESKSANVPVPAEVQDALHRAIQSSRIHYTLTGHTGEVLSVAFSPAGKLLATAGTDGTANLWDAASGEELMTLRGHTQAIEDIAFSRDGKYLATASDDKTVKIWDMATGTVLHTLAGHGGSVWSVSFSGDGELVASGGYDEAMVWDVRTGRLLRTLEGQHAPVAFNLVGKQLATSGADGTIRLWNPATWEEQVSLPYVANALAFSPDGKWIAAAMTELKVWDVATGKELYTATGFSASVRGIEFSPDGSRLATAGQDGTAIVWDAQTGQRMVVLAGHAGAINDISISPECDAPATASFHWCGRWLATAGRDGTAKVWDVSPAGSHELTTLPGTTGGFHDEMHLFTNMFTKADYSELEIQTWEVASDGNSRWTSSTAFHHATSMVNADMSADESRLVTLGMDSTVKVWDVQGGKEVSTFEISTSAINPTRFVPPIALSPDGAKIMTGNQDGIAKVWDVPAGKESLTLTVNVGPDFGVVAFSPDGTRIATGGSNDGTVKIWDASSGKELLTLTGHTLPVYAIAFSADEKRIATGGMDQTARLWDATSGKNLLTLAGHTASVAAVAFSPDGSRLITGGLDATARIWDISDEATTGQELLTLTGHNGGVDTVSFSPNGKLVATGSFEDGTVRVYLLDFWQLAALARSRLTRGFTLVECQKYLHQSTCP